MTAARGKLQPIALAACATCKYWCPEPEAGRNVVAEFGACRAHPPVPLVSDGEVTWSNPPTPADYGCGEHLQRPNS